MFNNLTLGRLKSQNRPQSIDSPPADVVSRGQVESSNTLLLLPRRHACSDESESSRQVMNTVSLAVSGI